MLWPAGSEVGQAKKSPQEMEEVPASVSLTRLFLFCMPLAHQAITC